MRKIQKVVARCHRFDCGAPLREIEFRDSAGHPVCARCHHAKRRAAPFEARVVRKDSNG